MRCERCGHDNRVSAKFCANCGQPVARAKPSFDSGVASLAAMQEDMQTQLNGAVASLDKQLTAWDAGPVSTRPQAATPTGPALVHPQQWSGLLTPQPDEVRQSVRFVFDSPHIQTNRQYQSRVGQIRFLFVSDDLTVNAFATGHPLRTGGGNTVEPPAIVFLGGLAYAIRLASAALALHVRALRRLGDTFATFGLKDVFHRMGRSVVEGKGRFDREASPRILREAAASMLAAADDRFVSLARSYSAAMEMFVVAHETGHIALGHTLGQSLNCDVSRNQEREADSFASSALCTSPFREYLFLGQVFVTIVFAWVDYAAGDRDATSHPLSRERFLNATNSNSEAAQEAAETLGLTFARLKELLPAEVSP